MARRFLQPSIAAHRHHAVDSQEARVATGQDVPPVRRDQEEQRGIHVSGKDNRTEVVVILSRSRDHYFSR